jgi:MFS family permease
LAEPTNGEREVVEYVGGLGLSPTVRALGVVSLLADVSSEMVYPVNPVFITKVLGAPPWVIGIIEGLAESTASILKLYSGWLSDRFRKRKPFAVAGYALGAIGKPLMGVSTLWEHVLGARFLDRLGKGLRTAPRDALITENCPQQQRGRAFGFHRTMDTTGAVLGPLIGFAFLQIWDDPRQLRWIYTVAFIPGLLAVLVLWRYVREDAPEVAVPKVTERPALPSWRALSPAYRQYLLIVALFSVGNSSDAFLLLRAGSVGVQPHHLLLLYALFNTVEAMLGYTVGRHSDRIGRRPLVALGYVVFAIVYLGFAVASHPAAIWGLFLLYGLYYTLTQGVQRALAADLSHADKRGTEIGAFHMVIGVLAFPASVIAGQLYDRVSPAAPFYLGAATAALSAVLMLASYRNGRGIGTRSPAP